MKTLNPNLKTIPVSTLVASLARLIESRSRMDAFLISGEISNVRCVRGNYYFILKDEQAQMDCILWKSVAAALDFEIADGLAVLAHGSVRLWQQRGALQFYVSELYLSGQGMLYIQLEQLKARLEKEGLFSPARKKPRPAVIGSIGIVTGKSTAALQDMLKTIHNRWPMLQVHLFAASVQGKDAPPAICKALREADAAGLDAVVLARGGGSFEDLFCFNDESIARTLAAMKTYTVTGIGHEIDYSIADFVADHRSVTPTAAAQWVTFDQNEVFARLRQIEATMNTSIQTIFNTTASRLVSLQTASPLADPQGYLKTRQDRLTIATAALKDGFSQIHRQSSVRLSSLDGALNAAISRYQQSVSSRLSTLSQAMLLNSPKASAARCRARLDSLQQAMNTQIRFRLDTQKARLEHCTSLINALSWQQTLDRGFSIVLADGHPVRSSDMLKAGQSIALFFARGEAKARITSIALPENDQAGKE